MEFEDYLKASGEIGYVSEIVHFIVYASGIPGAKMGEIIVFEDGHIGQVIGMHDETAEILLLSKTTARAGEKLTTTGRLLEVSVGPELLGKTIGPLGIRTGGESRFTDEPAPGILQRTIIDKPFETGTAIVDLVIPLGKGQRQLVVGDRKTGKTGFLLHTMLNQAKLGTVCVYAAIGKKMLEVKKLQEFIKARGIEGNVCVVSTTSSDSPGLIYLTPYTAMTIAEYFRDQGRDVFIILDDLSVHAKYYREIALLAKRFPGRGSYPGDIFYIHSKLLERAGSFPKASITALPVAESVLGDLSGYIQTNLMSMTDGHIFFDSELANLGRRPPISPFISVTRVGRQTQGDTVRDLNREVGSFLFSINKLKELLHFGAELSESVKRTLDLGDKMISFFDQPNGALVPTNMGVILISLLWAGFWKEAETPAMKVQMYKMNERYKTDSDYKKMVDSIIAGTSSFKGLIEVLKERGSTLVSG